MSGRKSKYLYLEVTRDRYEFPIHIEDSPIKLARKVGVNVNNIASAVGRGSKRYKRVLIEEVE